MPGLLGDAQQLRRYGRSRTRGCSQRAKSESEGNQSDKEPLGQALSIAYRSSAQDLRTRSTLEPHARPADAVGVWALIPLSGFALGIAVPRWWIVAAAAPFGAYILLTNELEDNIGLWVAFVLSSLLVCAIVSGVALRRLYRRRLRA